METFFNGKRCWECKHFSQSTKFEWGFCRRLPEILLVEEDKIGVPREWGCQHFEQRKYSPEITLRGDNHEG